MLHSQLAWYIAGPTLGLCVVATRLLINGRLGVTGGISALISLSLDWRAWFALGVTAAGLVSLLVFGTQTFHGYGWMTDSFHGSEQLVMVPLLVGSGFLIGYGAKRMGGCTSGNGLSGNAQLSPASLVSTAVFFGTAIVVTFIVEALR
jgi:hypothetical protein